MEKLSWRQSLHVKIKKIDYRNVLTYVGATTIYCAVIVIMTLLPLKLTAPSIPDAADPNLANSSNHLPAYCPLYTVLANGGGRPLSGGPLNLPFQRPETTCRTFTSSAMEKLITNLTSRMVDRDLARLFENAYPNTLGMSSF